MASIKRITSLLLFFLLLLFLCAVFIVVVSSWILSFSSWCSIIHYYFITPIVLSLLLSLKNTSVSVVNAFFRDVTVTHEDLRRRSYSFEVVVVFVLSSRLRTTSSASWIFGKEHAIITASPSLTRITNHFKTQERIIKLISEHLPTFKWAESYLTILPQNKELRTHVHAHEHSYTHAHARTHTRSHIQYSKLIKWTKIASFKNEYI